jgi:ribosomal protein S18 acetylase RimI-like enzyme
MIRTVNGPAPADYGIRVMTRAELDLAVDWAAHEGWNPGLDDARVFHAADPDGFFVGTLDGEPVASISLVAYDAAFAFLGFYVVKPQLRGRGFGIALWREAMARRARPLTGLDGVVAQQANYAKSGFRLAHRNIRFGGPAPSAAADTTRAIVPAVEVPFDGVLAYDRIFFPAPRPAFLSLWLTPPHGAALAMLDDGRIVGLGAIRACRQGCKIGPLYADNESVAEALFLRLAADARGGNVFLDVPEPNEAALRLVRRHGLAPVFETARMYTGAAPQIPLARLYGVTSFELG